MIRSLVCVSIKISYAVDVHKQGHDGSWKLVLQYNIPRPLYNTMLVLQDSNLKKFIKIYLKNFYYYHVVMIKLKNHLSIFLEYYFKSNC